MPTPLDRLSISGFKSIRELEELDLRTVNILIGANGSGKSNFVEIFRLLQALVSQNLAGYVLEHGGADDFLHNGPKQTESISAHFCFGANEYRFKLKPTVGEKFVFDEEAQKYNLGSWKIIGSKNYESRLPEVKNDSGLRSPVGVGHYVYEAISSWMVYHFHDTSPLAPMRRSEILDDNKRLRPDAGNIAPFLLKLKNNREKCYQEIVESIRIVTPFFDDFLLDPTRKGEKETVKLSWKQKGSDYPMQPYHFSDGTLRFICLTTALLQPNSPSTIVIDEPELGLHPYAIEILAEMIKSASKRMQVIISTQSPALVDCFLPGDVIVVNRKNGASTFERLDAKNLSDWLEDYSLGDLWRKQVIAGGPVSE